MLKQLRENFKHLKWILWAVIAIFVLFVFVDWGMGSARGGAGDTTLAAKAGGIRVTTAEFQKEYAFAEERYRQMYGKNFSPELARAMNLPEQVLNGMIDRRLLRGEAERLGIRVTDEELTQHLLGIKDPQSGRPLFVKDGVFVGDAAYKRILAANRLSPESFEADSRDALVLEKLNRFYTQSMVVGEDDLKSEFESRNVKAKIAWALAPPSIVAPVAVSDDGGRGVVQDEPDALHAAREAQGEVPPRRDGEAPALHPGVRRRRAGRLHGERRVVPQGRGSPRPAHPLQGRGRRTTRPRRRRPTPR